MVPAGLDNVSVLNGEKEKREVSGNKCALYLSVNVFSTKVLIRDTIFTPPAGDETAILRSHPSHARSSRLQWKGSTFNSLLF